ncbi:hypothetical protein J4457_01810 [Candidatus Woesearchaeota archaeon]|nr:hypothetical protein [Candidatus Woesearchaeota archaeon]
MQAGIVKSFSVDVKYRPGLFSSRQHGLVISHWIPKEDNDGREKSNIFIDYILGKLTEQLWTPIISKGYTGFGNTHGPLVTIGFVVDSVTVEYLIDVVQDASRSRRELLRALEDSGQQWGRSKTWYNQIQKDCKKEVYRLRPLTTLLALGQLNRHPDDNLDMILQEVTEFVQDDTASNPISFSEIQRLLEDSESLRRQRGLVIHPNEVAQVPYFFNQRLREYVENLMKTTEEELTTLLGESANTPQAQSPLIVMPHKETLLERRNYVRGVLDLPPLKSSDRPFV